MVTKERHGIIMSTILFLLYIFVFLLTELTVNARSTVILGSDHVVTLYAIGLLCTSLGYAGFSLSRRLVNSENSRKLLMVMLAIAYMGCTFCFMYVRSSAIFTVSALASLLLFGYIGGFAHYTVALFLFGKGCTGRVIGTAVAAATVLQFLVQNLLATDTALVISLAMSVAGMIYLAVKPVKDWMFENPLPYASAPTITAKAFLVPMSIVAVMSLCFGLGDGLVTQLDASGAANLTSWARLLYAVFVAAVLLNGPFPWRRRLCRKQSLYLCDVFVLRLLCDVFDGHVSGCCSDGGGQRVVGRYGAYCPWAVYRFDSRSFHNTSGSDRSAGDRRRGCMPVSCGAADDALCRTIECPPGESKRHIQPNGRICEALSAYAAGS